ncbi:folate-binding protein YgfZ [Georgenia sp. 311]|uniref:CAF17-like 4Fe-4S cluster assembly/insertion protein YgfZ n=1 Tax=Georgenia sp. 311 TaxID=2585134 RepID=UPI0021005078|nr:glycine cleavage T C-terminal barrel domain-containing protein [Georgenia sp. 311]
MTSPLLSRPGAVPAGGPDTGVALHYGRPAQEQRALEQGRGVVDLSQLGVLTVTGPDRLSWLNSLSSQLLLGLTPGVSGELLLLDPNGRIEHAAAVADDGERTWLVTEAGHVAGLAGFLDRMRFMLRVEVADVTDRTAVLGTYGDAWQALAAAPGHVLTWHDPWPTTAPGGTSYGPPDAEHPGRDLHPALSLVDRSRLVEAVDGSGLQLAGTWAWEALRVEAWRPRLGREVDDRAIPHELDWLRTAVHLDKGCYRGQETVARVYNLGRPPRRLVMLHLDGSEHVTPEPGERVLHGQRDVGAVTTVVRHAELGPVALAVVKRSLPEDVELTVGGIAAAQEVIVPSAGEAVGRPAERPGQELRRRPRP